jgi:hypothetical protein
MSAGGFARPVLCFVKRLFASTINWELPHKTENQGKKWSHRDLPRGIVFKEPMQFDHF